MTIVYIPRLTKDKIAPKGPKKYNEGMKMTTIRSTTHPANMTPAQVATFGHMVDIARATVGQAYNNVHPQGQDAPAVVMPVTGFGHDLARVGLDVARLATVTEVNHAHTAHVFARFGFDMENMALAGLAYNPDAPEPWAVGGAVVLTSTEDGHITAYWNGAHYFRTYDDARARFDAMTKNHSAWINEAIDAIGRAEVEA